MIFIRKYLEGEQLQTIDLLKFSYNKTHIDYGVDAVIDGITVNFAPYETTENEIIQRNFLTKRACGIDAFSNCYNERNQYKIISLLKQMLREYKFQHTI